MQRSTKPLQLVYWNLQGNAQAVRYALEYFGVPYTETRKEISEWENWLKEKPTLGLDFPNLPYIVDGDFKLSESMALLQYVALKAKQPQALGGDDIDRIKVTEMLGVLLDVKEAIFNVLWRDASTDEAKRKENFVKCKEKFDYFGKLLGDKEFLLGYITIPDFFLFYMLDLVNLIDAKEFESYNDPIKNYYKKFANLPQIKAYRETEAFKSLPWK